MTPTEVRARVMLELGRRDLERLRNRWTDAVEGDPLGAFDQLAHLAAMVGRLEAALERAQVGNVAELLGRIRPGTLCLN